MQELIIKWLRFVFSSLTAYSQQCIRCESTSHSCVASILQMNTLTVCHFEVDVVCLCISPWIVAFPRMPGSNEVHTRYKDQTQSLNAAQCFCFQFFFADAVRHSHFQPGYYFFHCSLRVLFVDTFCVVPMRCTYARAKCQTKCKKQFFLSYLMPLSTTRIFLLLDDCTVYYIFTIPFSRLQNLVVAASPSRFLRFYRSSQLTCTCSLCELV